VERIIAQNAENATERRDIFASSDFQRGDPVLAKTARGDWVARRVWNDAADVVYVCSERLFQDLSRGCSILWPIGFPKADIRRVS